MRSRSCTDAKFLLSIMTMISMLLPDVALAANRFWVGRTSNEWGNPANWSATSGGGAGVSVPSTGDAVFFDRLASATGGKTIFIKSGGIVRVAGIHLTNTFTGAIHTGTAAIQIGGSGFRMGSGHFRLGGSGSTNRNFFNSSGAFVMSGGVFRNGAAHNRMNLSGNLLHLSGSLVFSGTIIFNGGSADQTFAYRSNAGVNGVAGQLASTPGRVSRFSGVIVAAKGAGTIDDVFVSGGKLHLHNLTVNAGNFDMSASNRNLALSGSLTIANDSQADFSFGANTLTLSGGISTGAAGRFLTSATGTGRTIVLNGGNRRQAIDINGSKVMALTVTRSSSGVLTGDATVPGTLTINTGSLLAISSFNLYATGASIVNYGTIKDDTGKLSHTGSSFVVGNSSYARLDLFREDETVYFTLTDSDENIDGATADTVTITVTLNREGTTEDTETVTLTETAKESGVFRGSILTKNETASSQNGKLGHTKDATINALYTDAQDGLKNSGGGTFQVKGTSSSGSGGGSGGGGGGGRRAGASAPVQGPKKTPTPVRRELKETTKKRETVKKKETVKKVLKTKAELKKEQKAKKDARKSARKKK